MSMIEWDCPVCSQPNSADCVDCINCSCPYDCSQDELDQRRESYENLPLSESLHSSEFTMSALAEEPPIVPKTKFMGLFSPVPSIESSIFAFAAVYFAVLASVIPLALIFKPSATSSISSSAIFGGAIAVVEYWKRCNMQRSLRESKWIMIWGCFVVILIIDFLAFIIGINIFNAKFFSTVVIQKIGNIFILWLALGSKLIVGQKASDRVADVPNSTSQKN